MTNANTSSNTTAALITGIALGAIAAMALTPKTGDEMRNAILTKSRKAKQKLEKKREDAQEKVNTIADTAANNGIVS